MERSFIVIVASRSRGTAGRTPVCGQPVDAAGSDDWLTPPGMVPEADGRSSRGRRRAIVMTRSDGRRLRSVGVPSAITRRINDGQAVKSSSAPP